MPTIKAVKPLIFLLMLLSALPVWPLEEGLASWYGGQFEGRPTSSGEIFDSAKMTAAHRTLPFGTVVKVMNLDNGRSTVVTINDRGPFVEGRIIDLTRAAAQELDMVARGVARVSVEVLEPAVNRAMYAIQVGAYGLSLNAEKARARLEQAGFLVFLETTTPGITRVVVRGFRETDLADVKSRLAALGFRSPVVRIDTRSDGG
jgi:rare lipoprotein A